MKIARRNIGNFRYADDTPFMAEIKKELRILLKNFPQFVVIHIVKAFCVVNKAKVDVFLELSCFFKDPTVVGNLISDSSAFSNSSLNM